MNNIPRQFSGSAAAVAAAIALLVAGCDKRAPQPPSPSVAVAQVTPATPAPQDGPPPPVSQPVPPVAAAVPPAAAPTVQAPAPAVTPQFQAPPPRVVAVPAPAVRAPVVHLARVISIEPIRERPQGSGAGAVIGGVLGAVVGNQFGHGGGRTAMTVLGAGGGAVAGNNVERNMHERVAGYRVQVELANGGSQTFEEPSLDGLRVGDRVRIDGRRLRRV